MNSTITFQIFQKVWPVLNYWGQFSYWTHFWINNFRAAFGWEEFLQHISFWESVHMPAPGCLLPTAFHFFLGFEQLYRETTCHFQQTQEWGVCGYLPIHASTMFSLGVNVWKKRTPTIQSHEVERNLKCLSLSRALATNLCFFDMRSSSKVEARVPVKTGTCISVVLTGNLSALPQKKAQLQQLLCHMQHKAPHLIPVTWAAISSLPSALQVLPVPGVFWYRERLTALALKYDPLLQSDHSVHTVN